MLDPVVRAKVQFVSHLSNLVISGLWSYEKTKNATELFVHIPETHLISELVSKLVIIGLHPSLT